MTQSLHSSAQTGLHGTKRPAQLIGDLALAQALVIGQLDHDLLVVRKGMHGKIQAFPASFIRILRFVTYRRPQLLGVIRIGKQGTTCLEAQAIQGSAPGDGEQPDDKRTAL